MSEQHTEQVLPSKGLLLVLTAVGIIVAVFGLTLTGDFWRPWAGTWYFTGIGYALLDVGLGALLVFGFVERLLSRERKVVEERERKLWQAVEDKVKKLILAELSGIATEVINATNASAAGFASFDATNEQIEEQARNATIKKMEEMSQDLKLLRKNAEHAALNILKREHGDLFAQRADRLGDLQRRYWSHFLDPNTVGYLIDLEQALETLDMHTKITARERKHPRKRGMLEKALTGMYDQEVYRDLQTLLNLILQGIRDKRIEIL